MPRSSSSRSDNKRDRQDRKISNNRRERSKTFSGIPTAEIREVVSLFFKKIVDIILNEKSVPYLVSTFSEFFCYEFHFQGIDPGIKVIISRGTKLIVNSKVSPVSAYY